MKKNERLGERIRVLRLKRKLSQQKLADLIGSKQSTISMLEKGRRLPSYPVLIALAAKLGVSEKWFISEKV